MQAGVPQAKKGTPMKRRMKFRVIFLFALIFVFCLLAEIGLRVKFYFLQASTFETEYAGMFKVVENSGVNYVLKPHYEKKGYRINSQGLRSREFDKLKQTDIKRILVLGDSVVFGMGVYDQEKLFTTKLEESLNKRAVSDTRYEVLNAGIPAYNSTQELDFFREYGMEWQPDLVILGVCLNDWSNPARIGSIGVITGDESGSDWTLKEFIRKSFLVDFLVVLSKDILFAVFGYEFNSLDSIVHRSGWKTLETSILEMNKLAREKDIGFFVVIFPERRQLAHTDRHHAPQEKLRALFDQNKIAFTDLYEHFSSLDRRELFVGYGVHLSELGHEAAAEDIHRKLLPLL
ncbi:SGNH/GDSL hydrolase family protein [Acidobacteriota bacterium]